MGLKVIKGNSRGGITSYDNGLGALVHQVTGNFQGKSSDGLRGLIPIRQVLGVTKVQEGFPGKGLCKCAGNSQAAHTRIKQPNGAICVHHMLSLAFTAVVRSNPPLAKMIMPLLLDASNT